MAKVLSFTDDLARLKDAETLIVLGRSTRLLDDDVRSLLPPLPQGVWDDMVRRGSPGDSGRVATTYTGATAPRRLVVGVLPEACSRHNSPSRAWAIPGLLRGAGSSNQAAILCALDEPAHAVATAIAVTKAFPAWSGASKNTDSRVEAVLLAPATPSASNRAALAAEAARFAARLVDIPPNQLNTTSLLETARLVAARLPGVTFSAIVGDDLLTEGLGGLWNVGKASPHPPALVILDYSPAGATRRTAWIGKGIVYDTGGLALKAKTTMPGMKTDMAGAAAVLSAFAAAVELGAAQSITAVLCLAENAIGPTAMRPDDIITLYSGKTVEVNNPDAEGRLVLADGVAWAIRNRAPDEIVDLATLTGAQLTATGKRHAAIYCTDDALEARAIAAGRASGDLVHPLPFAPEFYRPEFQSPVADMKNSVKDRNNAQSSCAGQFILNHAEGWKGAFLHVDMCGPAVQSNGRGSGFGVGLLLTLAGVGAEPC